jgi:hypothetical protein
MPPLTTIPTGRLFTRRLADLATAVVGVIEAPKGVPLIEGALCLIDTNENLARIVRVEDHDSLPQALRGQGIQHALLYPCWPALTERTRVAIRAFALTEAATHWVVYGAARHPLPVTTSERGAGDVWLQVHAGHLTAVEEPIPTHGLQPAQTLCHPIWPGPDGECVTASQHPLTWRQHYHRLTLAMARCPNDPAAIDHLKVAFQRDAFLDAIRPGSIDPNYLRFLAVMDRKGLIHPERPRTVDEHAQYLAQVSACLAEASRVEDVPA